MKKLLIVATVVVAAFAVQASNWKWNATNIFDGTGSTEATAKYSGTAYIFDVATITQEALFNAYAKDKSFDYASKAIHSKTVTTGTISLPSGTGAYDFTYGTAGNKYAYYFAIFDGDKVYISNEKSNLTASSTSTATGITFASQNNATSSTFSSVAAAKGFQGAGHWSLASVPEPTSGLMMLIGVGLMALKRKRA